MPIICRTSPELLISDVLEQHPVRSMWMADVETCGYVLRINGNEVGVYGVKANGKSFAECGDYGAIAAEKLSIHMRTLNPYVDETRRAITALALSMWQVTY